MEPTQNKLTFEQIPESIYLIIQKLERIEQQLAGKPAKISQKYISSKEACQQTGLALSTLYKLSHLGLLPCYRGANGKGKLMFVPEELEAWMEKRTSQKISAADLSEFDRSMLDSDNELMAQEIMRGGAK